MAISFILPVTGEGMSKWFNSDKWDKKQSLLENFQKKKKRFLRCTRNTWNTKTNDLLFFLWVIFWNAQNCSKHFATSIRTTNYSKYSKPVKIRLLGLVAKKPTNTVTNSSVPILDTFSSRKTSLTHTNPVMSSHDTLCLFPYHGCHQSIWKYINDYAMIFFVN